PTTTVTTRQPRWPESTVEALYRTRRGSRRPDARRAWRSRVPRRASRRTCAAGRVDERLPTLAAEYAVDDQHPDEAVVAMGAVVVGGAPDRHAGVAPLVSRQQA